MDRRSDQHATDSPDRTPDRRGVLTELGGHTPTGSWERSRRWDPASPSTPMSRHALEHLTPMPVEVPRLRAPIRVMGIADRLPVVGHQRLLEARRAIGLV